MSEKVFESLEGQMCCIIEDSSVDLKGFIVSDSTINGKGAGGIRMIEDTSLNEVRELARSAVLKSGFLGLPEGGIKAGIVADGSSLPKEKKIILLKRFGEIAKPLLLGRRFITGPDMCTSQEEINEMLTHIGEKFVKRTHGKSGYYASLSVISAGVQSAAMKEIRLENATVAIEGFGEVGSNTAKRFHEKGSKIIAVSTRDGAIYNKNGLDIENVLELKKKFGDKFVLKKDNWKSIPLEGLLEIECDLLVPCARGHVINSTNGSKIRAEIVCPGANCAVTLEGEKILKEKGILSVPFFIANCGGLLGNSMEFSGLSDEKIRELFFNQLGRKIRRALELGLSYRGIPRVAVEEYSAKNFKKIKRKAEEKTFFNFVFWSALNVFKKTRIIPAFVVRPYSERYFKKILETW